MITNNQPKVINGDYEDLRSEMYTDPDDDCPGGGAVVGLFFALAFLGACAMGASIAVLFMR